ncbi:MAG: dimethyl sulfoxide reductase anchor subunit [Deltaproteobacteria bacterium]|nr:dimethyl sulfoxide reductase anchor subunit [Deltaproteobacteria bacterium]
MVVTDISLVLFTTLAQLAVGLTMMAAIRQAAAGPEPAPHLSREWLAAGIILAAALLISLFHLGHPGGSVRTLNHLATSWLSREVLSFAVFGGVLVAALVAVFKGASGARFLMLLTGVVGVVALVVSGMVYAPPSFPALSNALPVVFFLLTAVTLGAAFSSRFAAEPRQGLLAGILTAALVVGLVVNLLAPSMWLSGNLAARATGANFYGSWLFWARIVGEFAIPLAALAKTRRVAAWMPPLLLLGELAGRILFFGSVVHTATFIGHLY